MDINATLIGEIITFILFVWFTMKFVWPPLMKVMEARRKQIADGLAAAEQGHNEYELAQHKSKELLTEAKGEASSIIEQAHHRANHIVEEAKSNARDEGDRLMKIAKGDIEQEVNSARDQLLTQVTKISVNAAEKILKREVSTEGNDQLVDEVISEMK